LARPDDVWDVEEWNGEEWQPSGQITQAELDEFREG
jgi:hypothetical protein